MCKEAQVINSNEKGVRKMAVLAKPCGVAFELDPSKEDAFFSAAKTKNSFAKALARSTKHREQLRKEGKK